jgi:cholinesterase
MKISTFLPVTMLFLLPYLAESSALSVKTSNGLTVGHRASNRTNVFKYLGIPFAQPPVGSLRFALPEKYQCSANSSILVAAKYVIYLS